jgi:hypothetical protein
MNKVIDHALSESNQCIGKIHVKENIGWKTVESLKHNFKKLLIL